MFPAAKPQQRVSAASLTSNVDAEAANPTRLSVHNSLGDHNPPCTVAPDSESVATMKVCRACLATNVDMHHVSDHKLSDMYERVTGVQINSEDKLPEMLCWECVARLSSSNNFIKKALKTHWILLKKIIGDNITMSDIESIDRAQYQLESTLGVKYYEVNNTDLHIQSESDITSDDYDGSNDKLFINKYEGDEFIEEVEQFTIKSELLDITEQQDEADILVPKPIIVIKENLSDEEVTIDSVSKDSETSEENLTGHKDLEVCEAIKWNKRLHYHEEPRVALDVMLSLRKQSTQDSFKEVTSKCMSYSKVSNDIMKKKQPGRKPKRPNDFDKKCTLTKRPKHNPPLAILTSTDDSFMDTTDDEKNSYTPDNLLASLGEVSCTRDETHLIDQVACNIIIKETKQILVENNENTNSDTNMLESSHYHVNNVTKNHTVTSQSFRSSEAIFLPNIGLSQCRENLWVTPTEDCSVDPYVSKNHAITTSSPSMRDEEPTTSSYAANDDGSNCDENHSLENWDIDDSDQGETYNSATNSPSNTSYTEEAGDTMTNNKSESGTVGHLRRDTKITREIISNPDYPEEISTNESGKRSKRIRIKNYCFYCQTEVLNFARHVVRNHAMECEVQKILSYPTRSYTRKNLLTRLRKRGNYIKDEPKCCKPVKKSSAHPDYLPCEKCLGFYSKNQLWRHQRSCQPLSETADTQDEAQNFMVRDLEIDQKLKEIVFPKMRPDNISHEAKKDPLICAFGAQYLRTHREKKVVNITSRKMRILSKLLMEIKKVKPSIKDLRDSLNLQNYDVLVTAARKVSSYICLADRYSPTYAINMKGSLKQCCNIAITTLTSDSSAKTRADLKKLVHRLETNWTIDVSKQADSGLIKME